VRPYLQKQPKQRRTGGMAQVGEHLPRKHEAQTSKLQYHKKDNKYILSLLSTGISNNKNSLK
jgi:hypothetical protein